MKGLLTTVLATAWVLEVIWLQRIRRRPYERPDHIDRDFREMVRRVQVRPGGCPRTTVRQISHTLNEELVTDGSCSH